MIDRVLAAKLAESILQLSDNIEVLTKILSKADAETLSAIYTATKIMIRLETNPTTKLRLSPVLITLERYFEAKN